MSYLQRLLDAAPAQGVGRLIPAGGATSPVVGADQRLDIFLDFSTAFGPPPDVGDSAPRRDAPGPTADPVPHTPRPAPHGPAADPPQAHDAPESVGTPPASEPDRKDGAMRIEPPISPWQRIVEADPLTGTGAPEGDPARGSDPRTEPAMPRQTEEVRQVIERIIRADPAPPAAQGAVLMPPHSAPAEPVPPDDSPAPWPIGVEAFRPLDAPEPQRDAAPGTAHGTSPVTRAAEPAAPPRDIGPSPLATVSEDMARAVPPATTALRQARDIHTVEHIVERAPDPARPARMTAADASVIGPIRARRRGPRELAHGRG